MAPESGSGGLDPPDVRLAARPHARRRARPLAAPVHVLHLRLPPALRRCCGSRAATPSSRPPRSIAARAHAVRTDRGDVTRAADRRRARLAAGARAGRRTSSRRTRRSRAAWRSIRRASARTSSCGSTRATSTPATAGRSPRATSCGSASAPSTRTTRSSSRRCGWSRTSSAEPHGYQGNWIPHRIRPADRGRRVLRRRQRGPLPAADRRGHPDGVLLRDRARARAARRARGPPGRDAALRATTRSAASTAGSSRRCTPPSSRSATCTGARWTRLRALHAPARGELGVPALPGDRAAVAALPAPRSGFRAAAAAAASTRLEVGSGRGWSPRRGRITRLTTCRSECGLPVARLTSVAGTEVAPRRGG